MHEPLPPVVQAVDAASFDDAVAQGAVVVLAMRPASGPDEPALVAETDVALLEAWGVDLPRRLGRAKATGARGELVWIDLEREQPTAVVVLGLGAATPADLRRAAAAMTRRLRGCGTAVVRATADLDASGLRAFTEGVLLATGTVTWASKPPPALPRVSLVVADPEQGAHAVLDGAAHGHATLWARQLIHTPSNHKSPATIAQDAVAVAEDGLEVEVWDEAALARDGFGGLLAVGAGSINPPRLVRLTLAGAVPPGGQRHVVLVGKGITFDSGGLSLKPPDMQVGMKTDMSGAAVVLAVMQLLRGRVPSGLRVTGLLALAENLPGAGATRPGDVVIHHGGLTSEVVNTDAEGRLVLGDALDHAARDLRADVVVDVATLTGAATLGLGRRHAALYSTSDPLAAALREAGEAAGEQVWRMPLYADYAELIASDVADQANAGTATGWAPSPGSITAALFLARFVGDVPWAHLDIAGTGRSDAERDDLPKGGTGFGARLLLRWLEAGAPG